MKVGEALLTVDSLWLFVLSLDRLFLAGGEGRIGCEGDRWRCDALFSLFCVLLTDHQLGSSVLLCGGRWNVLAEVCVCGVADNTGCHGSAGWRWWGLSVGWGLRNGCHGHLWDPTDPYREAGAGPAQRGGDGVDGSGRGLSKAGAVRGSHTQGGERNKVLWGLQWVLRQQGVAGVRGRGKRSGLAGAGAALAPGAHANQSLSSLQVCVLQVAAWGGLLTVKSSPLQIGATLVHHHPFCPT